MSEKMVPLSSLEAVERELRDWQNGHANSVRAHAAAITRAETAEASLAAAREVLSSFHITVVEASFYKDVTLHLDAPHALSIRIRNDSNKSWIFKDLDDRRRAALAGSNGE